MGSSSRPGKVAGDLARISALSGIVSDLSETSGRVISEYAALVDALLAWRDSKQTNPSLELFDEVESFTSR